MADPSPLAFDNSYARLPEPFFRRVSPAPLKGARLACLNEALAAELGIAPADDDQRRALCACLAGERLPPGARPIAALYAGHQFGVYVPQLGDGRAILLGELLDAAGRRWDVQLKGAGITPYSRGGDGRAVLRSTVREYLCSEAMHHLGIPTTRALCLVASDEPVQRETVETGAILTRVASSHIRFGTFEVFYYNQQFGHLRRLADHTLARHYPERVDDPEPYAALLAEAVAHTAHLIAQWQLVGFAHGVLNTDNMSVAGLTLDYGPFGFMDGYDPGFVCNHSDHHGRYAFDRQPEIGLWNLSCLAQALLPLLHEEPEAAAERARAILAGYWELFQGHYRRGLAAKLGLPDDPQAPALAERLLDLMAAARVDYTNAFRELGRVVTEPAHADRLRGRFAEPAAFDTWLADYRRRLDAAPGEAATRRRAMDAVNPRYVLRNHLAQAAIERAEAGDYSELERLARVLRRPYEEQPGMSSYAAPPPAWAPAVAVSCSS